MPPGRPGWWVARELASHLRLKLKSPCGIRTPVAGGEGTGFSSEIETAQHTRRALALSQVARELASHLRLKPRHCQGIGILGGRGEGTGFSSEIETVLASAVPVWKKEWRGNWLLI